MSAFQIVSAFLLLCSRLTIFDQSNGQNNDDDDDDDGKKQTTPNETNHNEFENIFYSLFQPLLNKLHLYMEQLSNNIINENDNNVHVKPIKTTDSQFKLNCFELLTVAADFAQFDCGKALAKISITFVKSLLELTFKHDKNLFLQENMLTEFINYYNINQLKRTGLSAYIVQMLFDFYDHDKLSLEKKKKKKHVKSSSINSSYDSSESNSSDSTEEQDGLRATFSDEPEDQWSIVKYFDSIEIGMN